MSRGTLIDITAPLTNQTRVFPGDPPVRLRVASTSPARVTGLSCSVHAATHADAPCHVAGLSGGVETLPLEAFIGPACVHQGHGVWTRADVARLPQPLEPRLLLRGAPVLDLEAAAELLKLDIILVGTDGASIEAADSDDLPVHRLLLQRGVALIEGLDLSAARPGRYELIALPLLIPGSDGAPVRAVLRESA